MRIPSKRAALSVTICAIAIGLLLVGVARTPDHVPLAIERSAAEAAVPIAAGLHWFVGDGLFASAADSRGASVETTPVTWRSDLHVLNPGDTAAHVDIVIYRTTAAPSRSTVEVPAGAVYTVDLGRRRDVPQHEAFWVGVDADRPVFPQLVHQNYRPWDLVPEGLAVVPPQTAPLAAPANHWIYPDAFQGGTARWIEHETISLLNPGASAVRAQLRFSFRDGRGSRSHEVDVGPSRVAAVELATLFPDDGSPANPALSGDFSIEITASHPIVSQQTRRAYWRGKSELTSLSVRVPLRRDDVLSAREWYYAGGWVRDLDILPRDGQTDRTWQLLFTYALDGRARAARLQTMRGGQHVNPAQVALVPGRSDLQWLHLPPWHAQRADGTPWGLRLVSEGAIAPAVTVAEYEPWSQAMPGAMGSANLVSDVQAGRREAWLGVAYHGGSDDQPTDWSAAWQLLNPGRTPIRSVLTFHADGAAPIAHEVTVAPGAVARVTGDAVPGLPKGRPFVVVATADQPFAAHAWLRAQARGVPTIRALSSSAGVAVQLGTAALDDGAP
jgi:hypothetical protein